MVTESTVEWYRFTCPRCQAQWVAHYEVASFTDDAGQSRSFYRCHGLPCAAPARAAPPAPSAITPRCGPSCSATPQPTPSLSRLPPTAPASPPPLRHPGPFTASRQFMFKAVISLDPEARLPVTQAPAETHSVMVHAPRPDLPGSDRYFPAVIVRDDEQPLSPSDSNVIVTISVQTTRHPSSSPPGRTFALWTGTDVGHGTVSRHVFFS